MSTDLFDRYAALDPVAEADPAVFEAADLLAAIDGRTALMTTHDTISPRSLKGPRRAMLATAGTAIAVVAVVGALLIVDLGGGETLPASPAPPAVTAVQALTAQEREALAVLDAYVAAYNSRDIHGIMELFTEESSLINWGSGAIFNPRGLEEIRAAFEIEFQISAGGEAVTVSNVEVSGDTVSYEGKVRTRDVGTWCTSETMTVADGRILRIELPPPGGVACR